MLTRRSTTDDIIDNHGSQYGGTTVYHCHIKVEVEAGKEVEVEEEVEEKEGGGGKKRGPKKK